MRDLLIAIGIGAIVAGSGVATGQQVSMDPTVLDVHPTVAEFREEIFRADVVIRARVEKILRRKEGRLADQDAIVRVLRTYKGELDSQRPCVRMEIFQSLERKGEVKLANVGDELLLPIEIVHPYAGNSPPNGQRVHYMATFYYTIEPSGEVTSAFGFPADMTPYTTVDQMEALIVDEVNRAGSERPRFKLGEVLFTDDFDDGSLAGWTFLVGDHGFTKPPMNHEFDVLWIGPGSTLENSMGFEGEPPTTTLARDPKTGLYTCKHNNTVIEIGVADGRLRLRSSHVWRHLTVVTGDPEWTDYQIDVDVINRVDKEQRHARANYVKFGPYGRVHVPNFPETRGEHSFVGVEFGNFANYDVSEETFGNLAFQIRCKYPEPLTVWRDHSRLLRLTKILDYEAWPVPQHQKIHMTARFMGNRVEGHIDGRKILEGWIPRDHPGVARGRIALWAFETWAEFDNVRVTRLVPAEKK
ncbi:MAG: hypothetical protein ACC645_08760 [Pirellulales bacterium]